MARNCAISGAGQVWGPPRPRVRPADAHQRPCGGGAGRCRRAVRRSALPDVVATWSRPTPDRNEDWVKPSYVPQRDTQPVCALLQPSPHAGACAWRAQSAHAHSSTPGCPPGVALHPVSERHGLALTLVATWSHVAGHPAMAPGRAAAPVRALGPRVPAGGAT